MDTILSRVAQRRPYSLVQLVDGRILAFDRQTRSSVHLMTPAPAPTGTYLPARKGSVSIRKGVVTAVSADAASTIGRIIEPAALSRGDRRPEVRRRRTGGIGTIVDLKDRRLLLLRDAKAYILDVHPAPDGAYLTVAVGVIDVLDDTCDPPGMPVFDLPEDFAP